MAGADASGHLRERHSPETHLIPLALFAAARWNPVLRLFGSDGALGLGWMSGGAAVLTAGLVMGIMFGFTLQAFRALTGLAVPELVTATMNMMAGAALPAALFGLGGILYRYRPEGDIRAIAGMTALFIGVGFIIGGQTGMLIALVISVGTNVFAYWNSDKMVLRMHGATEVSASSQPGYYNQVADLARQAELPMPKVYLMDNPQPNAFATGRDPQNAAVACTTGLMQMLSKDELGGVIAHEPVHSQIGFYLW